MLNGVTTDLATAGSLLMVQITDSQLEQLRIVKAALNSLLSRVQKVRTELEDILVSILSPCALSPYPPCCNPFARPDSISPSSLAASALAATVCSSRTAAQGHVIMFSKGVIRLCKQRVGLGTQSGGKRQAYISFQALNSPVKADS